VNEMSDKLREAAQAAYKAMIAAELSDGSKREWEAAVNGLRAALAEPEPVAWYHNCFGTLELSRVQRLGWSPLYSAPPRREWVGLTREELAEILANCDLEERGAVAWMVEAKLREKNK
jgi:hypothetical protein